MNDTIVIRPIRDFLELEGFLGKALPLEEERAAMLEAVKKRAMG